MRGGGRWQYFLLALPHALESLMRMERFRRNICLHENVRILLANTIQAASSSTTWMRGASWSNALGAGTGATWTISSTGGARAPRPRGAARWGVVAFAPTSVHALKGFRTYSAPIGVL